MYDAGVDDLREGCFLLLHRLLLARMGNVAGSQRVSCLEFGI